MQSSILLAILVLTSQLGGGDRYDLLRDPAQQETPPTQDPAEFSPGTPAEATVAPAEGAAAPLTTQSTNQTSGEVASATGASGAAVDTKPSELWSTLGTAPATAQLPGSPLSLAAAVSGATSRAGQTTRVTAYWDLTAALADYYLALREATELDTLRQSISRPSFAWDEARLAQSTRVEAAKASAEAAQYRLQRLAGTFGSPGLPLPSDSPHAGAYETRYEENFAGRDSAEGLMLSELLPKLHQELRNDAAAIAADGQVLQSVSQQRDQQSDGTALLRMYELLSLRRREFVRTVADYNIHIARYSELATPGQVDTNRLVAMLIESPHTVSTPERGSDITRTSAEEPVDSRAPRRSTPRTFAPEDRPAAQLPPAAREGEERSILVQPQ